MTDSELEALLARWDSSPPPDDEVELVLSGGMRPPELPSWHQIDGSSNVAAVIYWPTHPPLGTLGVRFHNGGEYHYSRVPRWVFLALLSARSKGTNHWELIRRRGYDFTCITRPRKNWRATRP